MKFSSKKYLSIIFCLLFSCTSSFSKGSLPGFIILNGIGLFGHGFSFYFRSYAKGYELGESFMKKIAIGSHAVFGSFNLAGFLLFPKKEKEQKVSLKKEYKDQKKT